MALERPGLILFETQVSLLASYLYPGLHLAMHTFLWPLLRDRRIFLGHGYEASGKTNL